MSASGPFSLALLAVRELVASSTTFRTWVDADSESEALASVRAVNYERDSEEDGFERPFALVWPISHNFPYHGVMSAEWGLLFESEIGDDDTTPLLAYESFANNVGAVVSEMMANAQNSGRIVVRGIASQGPPVESAETEDKAYYQQVFTVSTGPN